MHVTQIYGWCGESPIFRIYKSESHVVHEGIYLIVCDFISFNEGLFHHYLEITVSVTPKANNRESCFRKICVMERNTVKGKDWLNNQDLLT